MLRGKLAFVLTSPFLSLAAPHYSGHRASVNATSHTSHLVPCACGAKGCRHEYVEDAGRRVAAGSLLSLPHVRTT